MKPYYQDDAVTIYHGDCREWRLDILAIEAHLVLTDPPYNATNIGPNQRVYEGSVMKLPDKEYSEFCQDWFSLVHYIPTKVFTPGIANTHNYPQPKWQLCWHKPASVSFNRMGGFNAWEPVFVYGDTKNVRLGQDYLLFNTMNFTKGPEADHPCPKPPSLWNYLVEKFCSEFGLIFDPFMGSGTTLRAAKDLGRKAIGIEIEEKYCEIAARRMEQEVLPLNDASNLKTEVEDTDSLFPKESSARSTPVYKAK